LLSTQKRYREQIEQQEAQIEVAVADHRVRRAWLAPSPKPKRRQRQSQPLKQERDRREEDEWVWEDPQHRTTTREIDEYILEKLAHPYRRLLLERGRGRGKMEPWHASLPV
jgi:hypothetical protein